MTDDTFPIVLAYMEPLEGLWATYYFTFFLTEEDIITIIDETFLEACVYIRHITSESIGHPATLYSTTAAVKLVRECYG